MRKWFLAAAAVPALIAGGLLGGCGDDKSKDPVVFGSAPPPAAKLEISAPAGDVVPASSWPSACAFLTDGEIKALLPQADRIERLPKKVSVISILDKAQNQSAAEGGCSYSFWLKGATIEDVDASVQITIAAVADPELVTEHYEEQRDQDRTRTDRDGIEDHREQFGPEGCYSWSASYTFTAVCHQGPLMFQVAGSGYGTFPGVPDGDLLAKGRQWRDKVLAPVAGIVAAKVP